MTIALVAGLALVALAMGAFVCCLAEQRQFRRPPFRDRETPQAAPQQRGPSEREQNEL